MEIRFSETSLLEIIFLVNLIKISSTEVSLLEKRLMELNLTRNKLIGV